MDLSEYPEKPLCALDLRSLVDNADLSSRALLGQHADLVWRTRVGRLRGHVRSDDRTSCMRHVGGAAASTPCAVQPPFKFLHVACSVDPDSDIDPCVFFIATNDISRIFLFGADAVRISARTVDPRGQHAIENMHAWGTRVTVRLRGWAAGSRLFDSLHFS